MTDFCGTCFRTNLAVTLVNAQISATAKYGKVFPHMNDDGAYPTDFSTPKTVETMRVLDSTWPLPLFPSTPIFQPPNYPSLQSRPPIFLFPPIHSPLSTTNAHLPPPSLEQNRFPT